MGNALHIQTVVLVLVRQKDITSSQSQAALQEQEKDLSDVQYESPPYQQNQLFYL